MELCVIQQTHKDLEGRKEVHLLKKTERTQSSYLIERDVYNDILHQAFNKLNLPSETPKP